MGRAEKTGYNDNNGIAIRDGDKVRGIVDGEIFVGEVAQDDDGQWYLGDKNKSWAPSLWEFDSLWRL